MKLELIKRCGQNQLYDISEAVEVYPGPAVVLSALPGP